MPASDKDGISSGKMTYYIMPNYYSNNFTINSTTGDIRVASNFDYEDEIKKFIITACASDYTTDPRQNNPGTVYLTHTHTQHTHIRTHKQTHMPARTCTHAHARTHMHARTCTHAHARTHMHARTCTRTTHNARTHMHARTCTRTCTHAHARTHMHAQCTHEHMHARTCTHAHARTHMHARTCTHALHVYCTQSYMHYYARTHAHYARTCTHARTHTHAHARARIRTHACTHTHAHARTHARTHTRTCTHARTHAHARTHTHARSTHARTPRTHMHARTCTHARTRMHAHACTHTHACTRIRMHAHVCTHTHARTRTHTHRVCWKVNDYYLGAESRTSCTLIQVCLSNIIDNIPQFPVTAVALEISEKTPVGALIYKLSGNNRGEALEYVYNTAKTSANDRLKFSLDAESGVIKLANTILDYESGQFKYDLYFYCRNGVNHNLLGNEFHLTINLVDINDNSPVFTKSLYTFEVKEGSPFGTFIGNVTAVDSDITSSLKTISYYIINPQYHNAFSVDKSTGNIYANGLLLDRESNVASLFTVCASDNVNDIHQQIPKKESREVCCGGESKYPRRK